MFTKALRKITVPNPRTALLELSKFREFADNLGCTPAAKEILETMLCFSQPLEPKPFDMFLSENELMCLYYATADCQLRSDIQKALDSMWKVD